MGGGDGDRTHHIQRLVHERTVYLLLGLFGGIHGFITPGFVGRSVANVGESFAGGRQLVGQTVRVADGFVGRARQLHGLQNVSDGHGWIGNGVDGGRAERRLLFALVGGRESGRIPFGGADQVEGAVEEGENQFPDS